MSEPNPAMLPETGGPSHVRASEIGASQNHPFPSFGSTCWQDRDSLQAAPTNTGANCHPKHQQQVGFAVVVTGIRSLDAFRPSSLRPRRGLESWLLTFLPLIPTGNAPISQPKRPEAFLYTA